MKKSILIIISLLFNINLLFAQNISVADGWQLKGAVEKIDISLFNNSCVDYIWKYDHTAESKWQLYIANEKEYGYNGATISSLNEGEGFWIRGNSTCNISTQSLNYDNYVDYQYISSDYTLLAWNDLGMHCMDGKDFSIFTILPPYNNLNAQLIKKDGTSNKHITSGVSLTYESTKSEYGKLNTISSNKTNFWDFSNLLFPNSNLSADVGLTGNKTPSLTPAALSYNSTHNWWEATGIPIMNYDDDLDVNYYPQVKVTAKDSSGVVLATTKVVLPVSDEMDCKKCHASNSLNDAKPSSGWANSTDILKDFKINILRLHDQKHPTSVSNHKTELLTLGYDYNISGLESTAQNGTPILCATCHKSNALSTSGFSGVKPLTQALHSKHADVKDPISGLTLNTDTNRDACYTCHPGASTSCLRGAMGKATGENQMQCQSCHGSMSDVGSPTRDGWFDEPNCQSCHQNGLRHTDAIETTTGFLREALDTRFATNPNTPMSGKSLYRFSTGHGKMQCSSCHGATHAILPSAHATDNTQSIDIQGHAGTVAECTACHTTIPRTSTGGPHGMHSIDQQWVENHEDAAKNGTSTCKSCHGADYRGSDLSKTFSARTFSAEHTTKSYVSGEIVGCYDCHNGPNGRDD